MNSEISQETKLKALCAVAESSKPKRRVGYTKNHTCKSCGERDDFKRVTWTGRAGTRNVLCLECYCGKIKDRLKRKVKKIHKKQPAETIEF